MSCQSCGRSGFELCAGCRTITRLKNLWCSLEPSDEGLGLSLLRECAGALTDVAEARGGSGARAPKERGERSRRRRRREEPGEDRSRGRRSRRSRTKEQEGRAPSKVREEGSKVDKKESKPEVGVKSEVPPAEEAGGEELEEEESEEEESRAEDPVVERRAVDRRRTLEPAKEERIDPEPSGRTLGLTNIGTQLSAPTPEALARPPSGEERKRDRSRPRGHERKELPRRRSPRRDGERRPRTPSRPPVRGPGGKRERSRSKKKKNKGKKKRQRGRDYWRHRDRAQGSWRRKQKPE